MPLSDFPPELLLKIATRLDAVETNALACTNRGLHNLLNEGLYCWDVTQRLSNNKSLIWAAKNGVEGTIQWAVDAAQKFNLISESFHIALQIAARRGHVHIVELLLKVHGIDPNFQGSLLRAAPLHLAAKNGHSAIVELLLAMANINPDVRDARGRRRDFTPLMYACWQGHISIVQQLLARNDVDFNARGRHYGTPLVLACLRGHLEIINLLLAKDSIKINLTDGITTPFIAAARMGLMEVVESLLARANFDPNIVANTGKYALGDAASRGDVDVMELLLAHPDVDPNFAGGLFDESSKSNDDIDTPLILGAGFPDVVKLLLNQQGIDVNRSDHFGDTALIKTACFNYVESAKLLLEQGNINVNILNSRGLTALHRASNRSLEVVDLLLKRDDIDLNPKDLDGNTPLALACRYQYPHNIRIVRSLLSHRNTDPNILNRNGNSILAGYRHRKADNLYVDEIESLLRKAGAIEVVTDLAKEQIGLW
ncbi:Ankyrin repeat-containing domain protein [Elaphomyces granulatus]